MPLSSVTAKSESVVAEVAGATAKDAVICFALFVVFVSVGALSPVLVGAVAVGSVVFSVTVSVAETD